MHFVFSTVIWLPVCFFVPFYLWQNSQSNSAMIMSVQIISIFCIMFDNDADGIFLSWIYFVRFYFAEHSRTRTATVLSSHYEKSSAASRYLITRWWSFSARTNRTGRWTFFDKSRWTNMYYCIYNICMSKCLFMIFWCITTRPILDLFFVFDAWVAAAQVLCSLLLPSVPGVCDSLTFSIVE